MRAQTLETSQLAEACIAVQEPLDGGAPRNTARMSARLHFMTRQLFDLARLGSLACATKQSKHEHEHTHIAAPMARGRPRRAGFLSSSTL